MGCLDSFYPHTSMSILEQIIVCKLFLFSFPQTLLPSSLSVEDVGILLQQVMRSLNKNSSGLVFSDTIVVSEKFLSSCAELFSDVMQQKAEKVQYFLFVKMRYTLSVGVQLTLLSICCYHLFTSHLKYILRRRAEKVYMYNQCNLIYIQLQSGNTILQYDQMLNFEVRNKYIFMCWTWKTCCQISILKNGLNVLYVSWLAVCIFLLLSAYSSFQEMKNNPVNLITEEDLKQASVLENAFANKKDKKDERRKKATGKASIVS